MSKAVQPKPTFTFAGGVTVTLERISPTLSVHVTAAYRQAVPPPEPPLQRLETGPNEWREIPNIANEDYKRALAEWQMQLMQRQTDALLDAAIGDDLPSDWPEAVARLRRTMERQHLPLPADLDDRLIYIRYILITDPGAEIKALLQAVRQYDVSSAAVEAARATFPGDLAGHQTGACAEDPGPGAGDGVV